MKKKFFEQFLPLGGTGQRRKTFFLNPTEIVFDPINQAALITNIVIITSKKASLSNRNPNKKQP